MQTYKELIIGFVLSIRYQEDNPIRQLQLLSLSSSSVSLRILELYLLCVSYLACI